MNDEDRGARFTWTAGDIVVSKDGGSDATPTKPAETPPRGAALMALLQKIKAHRKSAG